jgi:hypothetical protein
MPAGSGSLAPICDSRPSGHHSLRQDGAWGVIYADTVIFVWPRAIRWIPRARRSHRSALWDTSPGSQLISADQEVAYPSQGRKLNETAQRARGC